LIVALKSAAVALGSASLKVATVPLNDAPSTAETVLPTTVGGSTNVWKTARPPLTVSPTLNRGLRDSGARLTG